MTHVRLGGAWRVRADPDDVGLTERWWSAPWPDALSVHVPRDWRVQPFDDPPPVVWYRGTCPRPDGCDASSRIWLEFESVATDCTAWLNGREIGRHVGDYVPFRFDITDAVDRATDASELTIRVDRISAEKPDPEHWLQGGHITKGFHDVLSLAHGGIWLPVRVGCSGPVAIAPDGIDIKADPATGDVEVRVDVVGDADDVVVECVVDGVAARAPVGEPLGLRVDDPERWSPDRPRLYTATIVVSVGGVESERRHQTFGFRSVETDGRHMLLNGEPIFLSGVLDWGHEPRHGAPAPTRDELRVRFSRLRAMGFNCVCVCMWYPPREFYDVADETGMLLWQEHPIWQSDMADEHLPEYQRLCRAFMRRDRRHPSVIIVSATCEHPDLNPAFSAWWWDEARRALPDTLLQVQTASFAWADHARTDLHDEHTYEDAPRWVTYLRDLQGELDAHARDGRRRPFVMGESVLYTSWPDTRAIRAHVGRDRPWWLPKGFDGACAFEDALRRDSGDAVADRFVRQGDRFALRGRAFQLERFRGHAHHAGLVQNHLRDVPACRCGFLDDLDRWRFAPESTRPWLSPAILTLATPAHARAFTGGQTVTCTLGVSNFSSRDIRAAPSVNMTAGAAASPVPDVTCPKGEVRFVGVDVKLPDVTSPTRCTLAATLHGAESNAWDLWALPCPALDEDIRARTRCLEVPPIDPASIRLDVERGYSKGFGLAAPSAPFTPPHGPAACPALGSVIDPSGSVRTILTHRLTSALVDHLEAGGCVVMLCSNAPGGVGSVAEWHFGSVPLVFERGPLREGDSAWIIDCLLVDLIAGWCRAVPSETLGIADAVEPIIRQVFTHDQDRPVMLDLLASARVGGGTLVLSSLDHTTDAGRYLMSRVIEWLDASPATCGVIDAARVRAWSI